MPKQFLSSKNIPWIVALGATVGALALFVHGIQTPDGISVLPLDDAYIHLQYAWQTANGHFLQYNTGDAPTTGATSLLYLLLLAGGFVLGITHQAMPALAVAIGGACFVLTAALLADLAYRLANAARTDNKSIPAWSVGLLTGLLFAGNGWMTWAFLSGMETGLLIALIAGVLWALVARRAVLAALLASLAALTRPEAVLLGLGLMIAEWLVRDPAETESRRRRLLWTFLPFFAAILPLGINYAATGSLSSSGLQAKSLFTFVPFDLGFTLRVMASTAFDVIVKLFGGIPWNGRLSVFPLTQVLAVGGLVLLWKSGMLPARRLVLACLTWTLLGVAATSTLQTPGWHNYRYEMPLYPALLIPSGVALGYLTGRTASCLGQRSLITLRGVLALAAVAWVGFSLPTWWFAYTIDTSYIVHSYIVLSDWLRENTSADARVALVDAGVIRYYSDRLSIDVVGLTTSGMTHVRRNGPGSIYEAMETARPSYYFYGSTTDIPFFSVGQREGLLGPELFHVAFDSFPGVTAPTQTITHPDWSSVGFADLPRQPDIQAQLMGWEMVDRLDVADMVDEDAHDYQWWNNGTVDGFPTDIRRMHYREDPTITVTDGIRTLTGGESFTLHSRPNKPLMLVVRLHQTADMILRVRVNGTDAGRWQLPAIPGEWIESTFLVPPDLVSSDRTYLAITVDEMIDASPTTRYGPAYYWAYQQETPPASPLSPETGSQATFGNVARLVGFDLPETTFSAGDTLSLTLYWQAVTPPRADLRVFVHLTDPTNANSVEGVVAQIDSAPHRGAYPFWVWREGDVVSDTFTLFIPPNTPSGKYVLLIGIYDAATGQRQPIIGAVDFGSNRLWLGMITIR